MALLAGTGAGPGWAAAHKRPRPADYHVIVSVRDEVIKDARSLSRAISRCERRSRAPFGAGLERFNTCIRTRLSVEVELSRFEPVFLSEVAHHLRAGACLNLVGSLIGAISDLGEAASGWIADIENGARSRSRLERRDAVQLRQLSRQVIGLRTRPWARACGPR